MSDANELSLLGAERDRFKGAGVVTLLVLAAALGGFGLLLWVSLRVGHSDTPVKGWFYGGAFVAVGALLFWAARKRRASYVGLYDNGFAFHEEGEYAPRHPSLGRPH